MASIRFENPTSIMFGPVGAPISDMVEVEVQDMTLTFERTIQRVTNTQVAQPTERWCRYCGGGVEGDTIWRMSCDPCWEENHPTSFQVAQMYGEFRLENSATAQRVLSYVTTTA